MEAAQKWIIVIPVKGSGNLPAIEPEVASQQIIMIVFCRSELKKVKKDTELHY